MTKLNPLEQELGIDPVALRAKYRAERDRRLRPEGLGQFVRIDRDHHHRFEEDPALRPAQREPLTDTVEIALIGAGFGGLLLGAELRKAGFDSIRVIDRAGDFGGVWYWNRYPGAACDTEAPIYLPMLEELGVLPRRKYAKAPEIHAHCKLIAEKFDLYRDTCFHTDVTAIRWNDADGLWTILTDRGDAMRARHVVVSAGVMDRPKLADLPGPGELCRSRISHQPLGLWLYRRRAGWRPDGPCRQDQSASSARVRRRCNACRIWAPARSSSTFSSARPRRSTCAMTASSIRLSLQVWGRAGSSSGWRTSPLWLAGPSLKKTWSPMAGLRSRAM